MDTHGLYSKAKWQRGRGCVLVPFPIAVSQIHDKADLRKKEFVWAHRLRGSIPSHLGKHDGLKGVSCTRSQEAERNDLWCSACFLHFSPGLWRMACWYHMQLNLSANTLRDIPHGGFHDSSKLSPATVCVRKTGPRAQAHLGLPVKFPSTPRGFETAAR